MASGVYWNKFYSMLMNMLVTGDVKVMLLKSTYTPDLTNHQYRNQVSSHEIASGNGYTSGGISLSSKALLVDSTNKRITLDAANISWPASTITARYAVVYYNTGNPATDVLIKLIDFGAEKVSGGGGDFNITFDASGIIGAG